MIAMLAVLTLGVWAAFATIMWCTVDRPRHSDPGLHSQGSGLPHELWVLVDRADPYYPAVWHRGGLEWFMAPKPPKRHSCTPQTCSIDRWLTHQDRCACGGERFGVGPWQEVNSRWALQNGPHSRQGSSSESPSGTDGAADPAESRWPSTRLAAKERQARYRRIRRQAP